MSVRHGMGPAFLGLPQPPSNQRSPLHLADMPTADSCSNIHYQCHPYINREVKWWNHTWTGRTFQQPAPLHLPMCSTMATLWVAPKRGHPSDAYWLHTHTHLHVNTFVYIIKNSFQKSLGRKHSNNPCIWNKTIIPCGLCKPTHWMLVDVNCCISLGVAWFVKPTDKAKSVRIMPPNGPISKVPWSSTAGQNGLAQRQPGTCNPMNTFFFWKYSICAAFQ